MKTETLQKWEEQGNSLIESARAITITDQGTRQKAAEFTMNARRTIKLIEDEFKPDIKQAHDLHKSLLSRMNILTQRFKEGKLIVDKEISRDYFEQERVRKENERKAQAEIDAERKRLEEEQLRLAQEAEDAGNSDIAEEILGVELAPPAVEAVPEVQQTTRSAAGTTTVRKDIKVELVNKLDVIKAVHEHALPDGILAVDMSYAKKFAKLNKISVMPGFCITEVGVVSGRL